MMVSAALQAARVLNEPAVAEFAVRSLERVLLACYGPGRGVAHYFDGAPHVRGLLDDQILLANAALDAFEAGGNITYEMIAEELAYYALRTMWDEVDGGFFDRSQPDSNEAVGLLARRVKPFVSNCEAARLLIRVAASSGDHELLTNVRSILQSFAGFVSAHGPLGAHYVLAMREAEVR
jgi:uncharacterized protein YyaL (SSP411 family)